MNILVLVLLSARLTFGGLGEVRIGMSVAELERVADVRRGDLESGAAPCRYVLFEQATIGVRIARSRVVAIEVVDPHHRTLSGIVVGSSVAAVREAYGARAELDGSRFVVRSRDRMRALVIDTDGSVVTRLVSGEAKFAERLHACL